MPAAPVPWLRVDANRRLNKKFLLTGPWVYLLAPVLWEISKSCGLGGRLDETYYCAEYVGAWTGLMHEPEWEGFYRSRVESALRTMVDVHLVHRVGSEWTINDCEDYALTPEAKRSRRFRERQNNETSTRDASRSETSERFAQRVETCSNGEQRRRDGTGRDGTGRDGTKGGRRDPTTGDSALPAPLAVLTPLASLHQQLLRQRRQSYHGTVQEWTREYARALPLYPPSSADPPAQCDSVQRLREVLEFLASEYAEDLRTRDGRPWVSMARGPESLCRHLYDEDLDEAMQDAARIAYQINREAEQKAADAAARAKEQEDMARRKAQHEKDLRTLTPEQYDAALRDRLGPPPAVRFGLEAWERGILQRVEAFRRAQEEFPPEEETR
jgi:hypothetical protein